MQTAALYTSGVVFAAVAVGHATRLATGFDIAIAGTVLPVWVSLPGVLIGAALAAWMVVAARRA